MTTVDSFLRFCADASIDSSAYGASLRKFLLVYQRNLQHKVAFKVLFDDAFVDWEYIDRGLPRLDCAQWLALFKFVDFSRVQRSTEPMLANIDRILVRLKLDPLLTCPIFLLKNMLHVGAQQGIERLFTDQGIPDAYDKSLQFLAMSADAAFDLQQTTTVFCYIARLCTVDEARLGQEIEFISQRNQELSNSFKAKQARSTSGRPRLRDKLQTMKKATDSVISMHSFEAWSQAVGFPNVFSIKMRRRLYFLMSQTHVPSPSSFVHHITKDVHVCTALQSAAVSNPEPEELHRVITAMKLKDQPFKELDDFRAECLVGVLPQTQLNALNLSDMLHLYVAAYQHPAVWKDVWTAKLQTLSHVLVKEVEAFVARRPFNHAEIISILVSGG